MTKRKRFVITSASLSLGFICLGLLQEQYRLLGIGGLGVATTVLFAWSLKEGLGKNMTLLTLVLPVMFTLGVGLFWFLLPSSIFARIPIVVLYGFGIYALCSTSNIYTVAAIRTIALLRAAKGAGFVLTLTTLFIIFDTVLSVHWPIYISSTIIAGVSLLLFLQNLWSISLEKQLPNEVVAMTLISSLVIVEMSILVFFWPVSVILGSLFLTIVSYVLLGLGQAELEGRLFMQTIREYVFLGFLVFVGILFSTRWGG
jgi:hypothetical protein